MITIKHVSTIGEISGSYEISGEVEEIKSLIQYVFDKVLGVEAESNLEKIFKNYYPNGVKES